MQHEFAQCEIVTVWAQELHARTEEAQILRDKSVDELCGNLALSVVDQSLDRVEHERLKRLALELKGSLVQRTRELEQSVLYREELQRQQWMESVRSIVSETCSVAACIGQANAEAAEAKRTAQARHDLVAGQLRAAQAEVAALALKHKEVRGLGV